MAGRKRCFRSGLYVMVDTEAGPVLHKRCVGPCSEFKPRAAFGSKGKYWRSWCKACEQPIKLAWGQSEKGKAFYQRWRQSEKGKASNVAYRQSEKGKASRERIEARRAPITRQRCVYVVQLIAQPNVLKIGHTETLKRRLGSLKRRYGELHLLCVIPTEEHIALERQLHAQLRAFRLYEGAEKSELFELPTKAGKHAFSKVMTPYALYVMARPLWEIEHDVAPCKQEELFA